MGSASSGPPNATFSVTPVGRLMRVVCISLMICFLKSSPALAGEGTGAAGGGAHGNELNNRLQVAKNLFCRDAPFRPVWPASHVALRIVAHVVRQAVHLDA